MKRFFTLPLAILVLVLSAICATAQVNNYYVNSSSGSDASNGSQASPWKTINHADSALALGAAGTIVHVAACPSSTPCYLGVANHHNGTASQRITFLSDTKWGAKVKSGTFGASNPAGWEQWGSYTTIQDFDITSPGTMGIAVYADHAWEVGNHVHDTTGFAYPGDYAYYAPTPGCANYAAGIVVDSGHDHPGSMITGNVIHDISYALPVTDPNTGQPTPNAQNCNTGVGIYSAGSKGVVQNNIVYRVLVNGVATNHRATGMSITNNIIFSISKPGQTYGRGLLLASGPEGGPLSSSTINNNVVRDVAGQGQGIYCGGGIGSGNLLQANIVFGQAGVANSCGSGFTTNTITSNPLFLNYNPNPADPTVSGGSVSWSNADYHLQANSPAVGSGSSLCAAGGTLPCILTTDFDGVARANPPSIGANEFSTSAPLDLHAPTNLTATVH
ncbi:MAG TPA: hypothetical protein VK513_09840 [Terriglobales bacterium]|nr:hypothetical protein [Terriglobales bacterium]